MQLKQGIGLVNLNIGKRSVGEKSQAVNLRKGEAALTFSTHSQRGYMNWGGGGFPMGLMHWDP